MHRLKVRMSPTPLDKMVNHSRESNKSDTMLSVDSQTHDTNSSRERHSSISALAKAASVIKKKHADAKGRIHQKNIKAILNKASLLEGDFVERLQVPYAMSSVIVNDTDLTRKRESVSQDQQRQEID